MDAFEIVDVCTELAHSDALYHEFLRTAALSVGVYNLAVGTEDRQQPHTEEEVYYVVTGAGQIRVGDEDRPVQPGSIVHVMPGIEHRFHSITEDLYILVLFAPPEGTNNRKDEA